MTSAVLAPETALDVARVAAADYREAIAGFRSAGSPAGRVEAAWAAGEAMATGIDLIDAAGRVDDGKAVRALLRLRALVAGPRYPSGGDLAPEVEAILRDVGIPV